MHPILTAFTIFHVAINLAAIASGFVVAYGFLTSQPFPASTKWFLITTVATSVTGYFFPVHHLMPSHVVGAISLLVLAIAIFAIYRRQLTGHWRWIYVVTATLAFYLNFFVLIVQLFAKVPALKALAPTQSEPPFKMTQLVVLVVFTLIAILGSIRFRPGRAVVSQNIAPSFN